MVGEPSSTDTRIKPPENGTVAKTKSLRNHAWRAMVAYWILGLTNNYGYVVMLSAAHDILHNLEHQDHNTITNATINPNSRACNQMSTGAILLADIIPSLLTKFLAPFLPFYMHVRVGVCVVLAACGFICVAFAETQTLAILGVVVTSISSGLGEVSLLQFSSYYSKNVISTWSSGTGGAGVLGAISYTGLSVLGIRTAMLIMLFIPILMSVAFWIIRPPPRPDNEQCILEQRRAETHDQPKDYIAGLKNKLKLIPGLMKFMIPLGSVYLFEYFINQGMFELIYFEDEFIDNATQYKWLQVLYQIGVFVSRSSVNLFHISNIWLMSILQLLNVFIYTFEAIYAYIPSIWIVFVLTLWEGLLGGGAYVNTFYKISKDVPEDRKQFSMSVTSLSDAIGITFAGIFALPAHNAICKLNKPHRLSF